MSGLGRRSSSGVGLNKETTAPAEGVSTRSRAALTQKDPSQNEPSQSQTIKQDSHSRPRTRQGRDRDDQSEHESRLSGDFDTQYLHLEDDGPANPSSPIIDDQISPRKQGKAKDPGRKYLLEPGDQDKIIIVDATDDVRKPVKELDQEKLSDYTQRKPWIIQNAINNTLLELNRVNQDNEAWRRQILKHMAALSDVKDKLRVAETRIQSLNDPEDGDEKIKLYRENKAMAKELAELKRAMHSQSGHAGTSTKPIGSKQDILFNSYTQRPTSHQFRSNQQSQPDREEIRPQQTTGNEYIHPQTDQQFQTNTYGTGQLPRAVVETHDSRYKGPGFFHGTTDMDNFEAWRMGVESVFRNAPTMYGTDQRRIDFIRDNTKATAFNIVKGRADPRSGFPYETSDEAMQDLTNVFGEQDPYGKANAELHSQAFRMGYKNPKETFPEFYARFVTVTSNLRMSDRDKIESLKRNLSRRLLFKVSGILTESFQAYAICVRKIESDIRNADEIVARQTTQYPQSKTGFRSKTSIDTPKYAAREPPSKPNTFPRTKDGIKGINVPNHIIRTLRKSGKCFKCLKEGHRHNDDTAPCKDKDWPTKDELKTGLASIEIEWNGEEDATGYTDSEEEFASENDQSLI